MTPEVNKAETTMLSIQKWLLVDRAPIGYVIFALLGAGPIALAWAIGVHEDKALPTTSYLIELCKGLPHKSTLEGFFSRQNWMAFPVFLPLGLWLLRETVARLIGTSKRSALTRQDYAPFRHNTSQLVDNVRLIYFSLIAAFIIHVIDMYHVVERYFVRATTCPNDMDWGWYGFIFDDVAVWKVVILTISTTVEQFILVTIGLLLTAFMWAYNKRYLDTIYLRSKFEWDDSTQKYVSRDGLLHAFVLKFDDGNLRFGLGGMAKLFNWQLFLLSVVGIYMLFSRYKNVNSTAVAEKLKSIYDAIKHLGKTLDTPNLPLAEVTALFPDAGQWILAIAWLILGWVTMRPTGVKLLPFDEVTYEDGRIAYLQQIVPPETPEGKLLSTEKREDVDKVAEAFRAHAFWPAGNRKAAELMFFAAFVFLLILFPVPWAIEGLPPVILFISLSVAFAGSYLYLHKYRLRKVSPTLVGK